VADAVAADRGDLVAAVGGARHAAVGEGIVAVGGVARAARGDLAGRVQRVGEGHVVGGAAEIVAEPGEPPDRIVAPGAALAVAERDAGPEAAIIIGVGGEHAGARGRAVLADRRHVAGRVVIVSDVIAVAPGQPRAPPGEVILRGRDGAVEAARLARLAAERVVDEAQRLGVAAGRGDQPAEIVVGEEAVIFRNIKAFLALARGGSRS
jgi:hypothetical protein